MADFLQLFVDDQRLESVSLPQSFPETQPAVPHQSAHRHGAGPLMEKALQLERGVVTPLS